MRKKRWKTAKGPMTMTTWQRLNTASGCSSGCGAITVAMWAGRAGCSCPRRSFLRLSSVARHPAAASRRPLTSPHGITRWAAHHPAVQRPLPHPALLREGQHSLQVAVNPVLWGDRVISCFIKHVNKCWIWRIGIHLHFIYLYNYVSPQSPIICFFSIIYHVHTLRRLKG